MKARRGCKVKWLSALTDHWFRGVVRRVIDDRAIVDDGTGLSYRVIDTSRLIVTNDPSRLTLKHK